MTKLEKLLKDHEQAKADKAALEQEMATLKADKERLEGEAEAAAQEGNIPLYREKRDAAQLKADTIFVRNKQAEKLKVLATEAEAKAAWKDYAESYNKAFAKSWAAYEKARRDLCAAFLEIVNAQNEALRMRAKCAECAGIPDDGGFMSPSGYDRILHMDMIPDEQKRQRLAGQIFTKGPDVDFFFDAQLCDPAKLDLLNQVVRWHKPV